MDITSITYSEERLLIRICDAIGELAVDASDDAIAALTLVADALVSGDREAIGQATHILVQRLEETSDERTDRELSELQLERINIAPMLGRLFF